MIGTQGWLVEHAIVCRVSECYPSLKQTYPVWENRRIEKCRNKTGHVASRHEPSYDSDDAPHRGRVAVGGGCFSFGGTVQYIEESNIYLCFVVCRLKRGLVT